MSAHGRSGAFVSAEAAAECGWKRHVMDIPERGTVAQYSAKSVSIVSQEVMISSAVGERSPPGQREPRHRVSRQNRNARAGNEVDRTRQGHAYFAASRHSRGVGVGQGKFPQVLSSSVHVHSMRREVSVASHCERAQNALSSCTASAFL